MKQGLTFKIDSIVDIITNSSSELFVCYTDQALSTIEQYLKDLCHEHNVNYENVFGSIIVIDESNIDEIIAEYIVDGWQFNFGLSKLPTRLDYDEYPVVYKDGRTVPYKDCTWESIDNKKTAKIKQQIIQRWIEQNITIEMRKQLLGVVLIESAEDNSIPYDMFDEIQSTFNAIRYHLG